MTTNDIKKGDSLKLNVDGETRNWNVVKENKTTFTITTSWEIRTGFKCSKTRYLHKKTGKVSK